MLNVKQADAEHLNIYRFQNSQVINVQRTDILNE